MEGDAARKEDNLTYSYNFICPQSYHINEEGLQWTVIEKGFERLNPEQLKISVERIKSALSQLGKHINITPWDQIQRLYRGLYDIGFKISLKEELYQVTSSVKARGVVYSLLQLSNEQKRKGVIAISTGSFAHSLCHFGKKFGIPVTIVMIKSAENGEASVVTCLKLGARVYLQDDIVPAYKQALSIAEERGLVYIDGYSFFTEISIKLKIKVEKYFIRDTLSLLLLNIYDRIIQRYFSDRNDHPNMIIGQATLGIEMMEQANDVDAVILPTSDDGCGLTAGIAMAVKSQNPNIKVIVSKQVHFLTANCKMLFPTSI
ncbi:L-threonine ammonia-lyase-like [Temnothorax nylanderi]|uniref:L-threonine ammonia-lyase-like n=1 Tax=Temnothorax nylanderi TaxID=102681 RepID=UPI003A8A066F